MTRIAVVAPANTVKRETEPKIQALVAAHFGDRAEVVFHPQCRLVEGHFAGSDAARSAAFLEVANDPAVHAVWFGRGGYGSNRLDPALWEKLNAAARRKIYLGYSDLGFVLARLYREGIGRPVHGPVASDVNRTGGEMAALRVLRYLVDGDASGVEPSARQKTLALNLTVLGALLGGAHEPDFTGHVLMLEDVAEPYYRIDRTLFQVTSSPNVRRAAGIRLGRISAVPPNDPDFGRTEEEIFQYWCARSGIPYLGRADVGHDAGNKIVPFGGVRTS
jgi:muramoyltetrapeptide carboxypeptidase